MDNRICNSERYATQSEWEEPVQGRKLYVDGLNLQCALGFNEKWWDQCLRVGEERITAFVKAAKAQGIELRIFIDAWRKSEEVKSKWKDRRTQEVLNSKRRAPYAVGTLMGEMFRENGIEVCYSITEDLDDCLAKWAQDDGADVVSEDCDFFRYRGHTYRQYLCRLEGGKIMLQRKEQPKKSILEKDFLVKRPLMYHEPPSLPLDGQYIFGPASPLVKLCGNPHAHARVTDLRAALYAQRGLKGKVQEVRVEWTKDYKLDWGASELSPNSVGLCWFQMDPETLYQSFFGTQNKPPNVSNWDWRNHIFGCRAVVFELWLSGQKDVKDKKTLLSLMRANHLIKTKRGEKRESGWWRGR